MPGRRPSQFRQSILQALEGHPDGLTGPALTELAADIVGVSTEERSGAFREGLPEHVVRVRQARYFLLRRGLVAKRDDKRWELTDAGRTLLVELRQQWRPPEDEAKEGAALPELAELEENPVERVDRALREVTEAVEEEIAARLATSTPWFFERLVLRLLGAMGYGRWVHTGRPGDKGIDGIMLADPLGLERVYVQAKRWKLDLVVPPKEVRDFSGAVVEKKGHKGVFITTSGFSEDAEKAALASPAVIELIDGRRLASLMIEHGVGVSRAQVRVIPEVDVSVFDDD